MSEVLRKVWRCDRPHCGHEWISPIVAQQCPKCRSRKWNELDRLGEKPELSQSDSPESSKLSEPHSLTYTSFEDW